MLTTDTDRPRLAAALTRCGVVTAMGCDSYVDLQDLPSLAQIGEGAPSLLDEIAAALAYHVEERTGGAFSVRPAHPAVAFDPDPDSLYVVRYEKKKDPGSGLVVCRTCPEMSLIQLDFTVRYGYSYGVPWASEHTINERLAVLEGQR